MVVISLKDYAKKNNISYEAVRQQVVRYKVELADHIVRDGRQQFLDEEAVLFLDSKRQKNPVAIIHMDKDEQIEKLEQENKILLQQIAIVQDDLLKEKNKTHQLELENAKIARLEADNELQRVEIAEINKKALETVSKAEKELLDIKEQLKAEKGRKLTLKERFFGIKNSNK